MQMHSTLFSSQNPKWFQASEYFLLFCCWLLVDSSPCFLFSSLRSRGRPLPALVRLLGRLLLRPPLLDQNLQAGAAAGRGVHQAEEERLPRPGDLPALRLRQGPLLQGVERCHLLVQVQAAHVPEDLKRRQLPWARRPRSPSATESFKGENGLWLH